jgi:hypothetical protein
MAAVVALVLGAAAISSLNRGDTPATPAQPTAAEVIDQFAAATTIASKANFKGTCRPNGLGFAFDVTGEVTLYANGSRTLTAYPVPQQAVFATNGYMPPASISLDGAWWEVSGRPEGKATLPAAAGGTTAALTCEVELPKAA